MRTYTLHPQGVKPFLQLSGEAAALRSHLLPGFRGCELCGAAAASARLRRWPSR
jgi:hypothetical protein